MSKQLEKELIFYDKLSLDYTLTSPAHRLTPIVSKQKKAFFTPFFVLISLCSCEIAVEPLIPKLSVAAKSA